MLRYDVLNLKMIDGDFMPLFCLIKRCISSYIDSSTHKHHVQIFFITIYDQEVGYKIYQSHSSYRQTHIRFLFAV